MWLSIVTAHPATTCEHYDQDNTLIAWTLSVLHAIEMLCRVFGRSIATLLTSPT